MTPSTTKEDRRRLERLEDQVLLQFASHCCSLSQGNILVIGEKLAIPEISGNKRLIKRRGTGLELIVNEEGRKALQSSSNTEIETHSHPKSEAEWYSIQKDGRPAVFWYDRITFQRGGHVVRDYKIPERTFSEAVRRETTGGRLYTVSNEFDIAVKIMKNLHEYNGRINPEDALNAASAIIGMESSGREFNHRALVDYLTEGKSLPGYLYDIGRIAVNNLPKKDRPPLLLNVLERGIQYLEPDNQKELYKVRMLKNVE